MRWPALQARLAAGTELGAGILFAAGLLTPLAAAGMIGVMTVATYAAHRGNFFVFKDGWEYTVAIAVAAWAVATVGPGDASLDHAVGLDWTAWDGWIGAVIAASSGSAGPPPSWRSATDRSRRVREFRRDRDRHPAGRRRGTAAAEPVALRDPRRRRRCSPRSGSGRCSSRRRSRSTGSARSTGRRAQAICERPTPSARTSPTSARSRTTTRRWSPSAPTSSTGPPTSSTRCSTTRRRPPHRRQGVELVPLWEADYRTYLGDRRAFSEACGPATTTVRGDRGRRHPDQRKIARFAADNDMPACSPPTDLGSGQDPVPSVRCGRIGPDRTDSTVDH